VNRVGIAIACGVVGLLFGMARAGQPSSFVVSKPAAIFQGGIAELEVSGAELTSVEGRFGQEKIPFYLNDRGNFTALLGVDLEAKPGPAKILIKSAARTGASRETQIVLPIKAKSFPHEEFSVAPEFDQLTPDVLERVRREQEQFARAFSISAPTRFWEKPFMMPVAMEVSSPFGYRRVINGTPRAPHTGVDLRAPMGTEVLTANHGRVVLVGDFFFSGKSVVVDHGGGLYTLYFHFSDFKVEEGAEVRRGDVIGISGMTGRVTGPHLHWSARLNGARIDPFELIDKSGGKLNRPVRADAKSD
jgi:murein DD-endopeptidase MepM/ murein hydrolase activator NlpD